MQTLKVNRFEIETAVYKGPIEVLLELIETKKLLVNELSLSQVTADGDTDSVFVLCRGRTQVLI